jgi:hypothetical protein
VSDLTHVLQVPNLLLGPLFIHGTDNRGNIPGHKTELHFTAPFTLLLTGTARHILQIGHLIFTAPADLLLLRLLSALFISPQHEQRTLVAVCTQLRVSSVIGPRTSNPF